MRDAPEKLAAAPNEMSAHVMQPRAASAVIALRCRAGPQVRQDRCAHVDVSEQRRFARPQPRSIEALE